MRDGGSRCLGGSEVSDNLEGAREDSHSSSRVAQEYGFGPSREGGQVILEEMSPTGEFKEGQSPNYVENIVSILIGGHRNDFMFEERKLFPLAAVTIN